MGDRSNPIKFGPEWLRNLSRERTAESTNNSQSGTGSSSTRPAGSPGSNFSTVNTSETGNMGSSATSAVATGNSSLAGTAGGTLTSSTPSSSCSANTRDTNPNPLLRVRLANRRYGREEMLALCNKTADPPEELKHFELLYQPREKQPFALNTFDEEAQRDTGRGQPTSTMPLERFGRVSTRGGSMGGDSRGRSRMPFARNIGAARGINALHVGNARMPGFGNGPDEEASSSVRPWTSSNGGGVANRTTETFRRRANNHTNWRQTSRENEDERRNADSSTGRHNRSNLEKWDWNETERKPISERPQPWSGNRRAWAQGDTQNCNEDCNLPEWAVDNGETSAGSFDSTGAFLGYSNDDSNIPTTTEGTYPLVRSQTYGSFARPKLEETTANWWSSEKAKKLSPKKFDVRDARSTQSTNIVSNDPQPSTSVVTHNPATENLSELDLLTGDTSSSPEPPQNHSLKYMFYKHFDKTVRHTMEFINPHADTSIQAVLMHIKDRVDHPYQHTVNPPPEQQGLHSDTYHTLHNRPLHALSGSSSVADVPIVDDLLDLSLNDNQMQQANMPVAGNAPNFVPQNPNLDNRMVMPALAAPTPAISTANLQTTAVNSIGVQNRALNLGGASTLGLSLHPPLSENALGGILPPKLPPHLPPGTPAGVGRGRRAYLPPIPAFDVCSDSFFMGYDNPMYLSTVRNMPVPPNQEPANPYPMDTGRQQLGESLDTMYSYAPQLHSINLADQWYYEDPKNVIQGPFTSREMCQWYNAGFFGPSLMVRRGFETQMRPLGSYSPDLEAYQRPRYEDPETGLSSLDPPRGEEHQIINNHQNRMERPTVFHCMSEPKRYGIQQAPQLAPRPTDQIWRQSTLGRNVMWLPKHPNNNNEDGVNNLPLYFWDPLPTANTMNLPADVMKEMKTEDEILAQLRATQNICMPESVPLPADSAPTTTSSSKTVSTSDENFNVGATPDLEKLQQLIQSETLTPTSDTKSDSGESETKSENSDKQELAAEPVVVQLQTAQTKVPSDSKSNKQSKNESGKPTKIKNSINVSKAKNKKTKEEKKEELDSKIKAELEKASVESSPSKSKKDEKQTKKELEKEKKEWIKEGFTIVKGAEKNVNKENKKKAEEVKAAEEIDKKKKEEDKLALDEEKKKKKAEVVKKQQQRQLSDSLSKRAWDLNAQAAAANKGGLTLSEIQRLERDKKLEQIKEQQHMMHLIAQQQAAALAREQEMQANLAWAKNNLSNNGTGPSLAEIQAETRRQSAAAAAVTTQSIEEVIPLPPLPTTLVPWGHSTNGGGFWDTQPSVSKSEKPQEPVKVTENKIKKKVTASTPKRETSPNSEFEAWCTTVLALWRAKIDVPTFVGFLKDIESPYEVKDYVKGYLGDSKDSNDFARQFLEKRSKLLRVGMVTPSDDLCSPAIAVNPRAPLSDYQEVKGKGKKSKKNKMLKVDARILGFSVTAAEDRINVGDIDTA